MQEQLKDFFQYSKKERLGILVLLAVIGLFFALPSWYEYTFPAQTKDFKPFKEAITAFNYRPAEEEKEGTPKAKYTTYKPYKKDFAKVKKQKKSFSRFDFNPNSASKEDFVKLGLSEKIAARIEKYRNAGGSYRKTSDFARMYGLSENLFLELEPYIKIPVKTNKQADFASETAEKQADTAYSDAPKEKKTYRPKWEKVEINVNEANAEEWAKLYGIGPTLSSRIVKFRTKLGGFVSVNQVGEVYGVADSTFQKILPQLLMGEQRLTKLNLNTATVEELAGHPYLKKKHAYIILNYRNQHGNFASIDDLKEVKVITAELFKKLSPYLTIE